MKNEESDEEVVDGNDMDSVMKKLIKSYEQNN